MDLNQAITIVRDALKAASTSPGRNNPEHKVFNDTEGESSGLNIIYSIADQSIDQLETIARTARGLAEVRREQGRRAAKVSVKELQDEIFQEDYRSLIDKALANKDIIYVRRKQYNLAGASFNVPYESLDMKLTGEQETQLIISIERQLAHKEVPTGQWKFEINFSASKFPETARTIPSNGGSPYKYKPEAKLLDELYTTAISKLAGKDTYTQK